ncbi:MAG: hypothetical protein Q9157_003840 [Trypethelium eluteriae]
MISSALSLVALSALGFLPVTLSTTAPESSFAICQQLDTAPDPDIFLPNETGYAELREENWSQTAWRTPACIFQPRHVEHLAIVVSRLVRSGTSFAIRSGGHSPAPAAANIDGGILIDMTGFNHSYYDAENNVAIVGSGLTWGEVYTYLDEFNVTVVGGRVSDVGVGGLTLGGGLSYLSDLYGLVCDNVVNFEVVQANGSIINANKTHYSDLFWALKAKYQEGIVTSFTLSTYPIKQVWAGVKAYTKEDLPAIFEAMFKYQTVARKDPLANLMLQGYMSNTTTEIILNMVYLAPEEAPSAFAPFYHINTTSDSTKLTTLTEFISGQGPGTFPQRVDWRSKSFEPDDALYKSLNSIMTGSAFLQEITDVTNGTVALGLQPISASVIEAGFARGGNALGLSAINQTWYVIDSGWWDEEYDEMVHFATRDLVNQIGNQSNTPDSFIFMNDASYDQDVIGHYGKENVAKLTEVQAKYDPDQIFQKLVPGGFKLPNIS